MKGIRFYEVYDSPQAKRKGESKGNIIAIDPDSLLHNFEAGYKPLYDCMAAIFLYPNSEVTWCNASQEYIWENCKHVSEAHAREVHPKLFKRLDEDWPEVLAHIAELEAEKNV